MKGLTLVEKEAEFLSSSAADIEEIKETHIEDLAAAIAEAAYYHAEKRGFEPGYEEQDWLAAEQEVRSMHA
jgi:Protein of unknown function (DUF2934)